MTTHTFAEGETVRVAGWRGVFRLHRLRLVAGEAEVWGPGDKPGIRTVTSDRLLPARRGDIGPAHAAIAAPARRAGAR